MAASSAASCAVNCATVERWVSVCCRVANSPSLVKRCRSRLALARLASSWAFLALAPGAHEIGVDALNGSKPAEIDRKIRFRDRRDGDGNGGTARRSSRLLSGIGGRRIRAVKSLPAEIPRRDKRGDR